ncbi:MAG: hypothetical protein R2828_21055 [Saprospiraceae bacterium]
MPKAAVIDMGTNTFHLLVAETDDKHGFREVFKVKRFVKLAEEGIAVIGVRAFHRAMETLLDYRQILDEFQIELVKVMGTAALRTASNGPNLLAWAKKEVGFDIQVIGGAEEARLIHQGVCFSMPEMPGRCLIMDIGGGSVEFIIAEGAKALWAQSFPIGAAVLLREFHHRDPIDETEVAAIDGFLNQQLTPLQLALEQWPTTHLIGAAGTFDIVARQIAEPPLSPHIWHIEMEKFPPLYQEIICTTIEERQQNSKIPIDRVDMIVVALVLIQYVLEHYRIQQFTVSAFALKEGVMGELLGGNSELKTNEL